MKPAKPIKPRGKKRPTFEQLEKLAHDVTDISPLSAPMRRRWEAARRTGAKVARGRPRKDPKLKSRIVPVSMDPALLKEVDRFADAAGVSRSRLIAEALRLRMGT